MIDILALFAPKADGSPPTAADLNARFNAANPPADDDEIALAALAAQPVTVEEVEAAYIEVRKFRQEMLLARLKGSDA